MTLATSRPISTHASISRHGQMQMTKWPWRTTFFNKTSCIETKILKYKLTVQSGGSQQKGTGSQLWGTRSVIRGSGSQTLRGARSEIRCPVGSPSGGTPPNLTTASICTLSQSRDPRLARPTTRRFCPSHRRPLEWRRAVGHRHGGGVMTRRPS